MIKELLIVFVLLSTSHVFAQELNDWQEDKLYEELEQMVDVMQLTDQQTEKMKAVITDQILANAKLMKTIAKGTKESKAAWKAHGSLYWALQKNIVENDQWKKWTKHQKEMRKKKAEGTYDYSLLTRRATAKVKIEVEKMAEVMLLSSQEQAAVYELKLAFAKVSQKIYKTMNEGPEREQLWQALNKETNKKIRIATSNEQMQLWWKFYPEWLVIKGS